MRSCPEVRKPFSIVVEEEEGLHEVTLSQFLQHGVMEGRGELSYCQWQKQDLKAGDRFQPAVGGEADSCCNLNCV
jgi:hypothetical protein